jgi:hypothetical protein
MSVASSIARGPHDDGRLGDAWRATQYGVLWACAILGMESMATPFIAGRSDVTRFIASLLPFWGVKCVAMAYLALRTERRHRGLDLLGRLVLFGFALSLLSTVWLTVVYSQSSIYRFRPGVEDAAIFWYDIWSMLFYCSLLVVGCIVISRVHRMRQLLDRAQIDRGLTEALVAEIRLKEMQASLDPEVLYGALAEVMRRYVAGSPTADRLLDCLVGFLRSAMPSLREAASPLAGELELTRAYVRLRGELDPELGAWRIEAADDLGSLLIPPLQLVDLLDRWTAAGSGRTGGVMAITRCAGGARVELRADTDPRPDTPSASGSGPAVLTFDFLNPAYLPATG